MAPRCGPGSSPSPGPSPTRPGPRVPRCAAGVRSFAPNGWRFPPWPPLLPRGGFHRNHRNDVSAPGDKEARVSIGATLAAARRRARLTVSEVSQNTRVTEPIIQGIEHDDYAACGGDFYARGHIRAIARAVGEDPSPLIDEFDATWRSAKEITAAEAFQPSMPLRKRERRRVRWTAILAALVLAVLGFASYKFVSGVGRSQPAAATSPRPSPAGGNTNPPASAPAVQGSSAQASATQSSPVASPSTASP